jgi:ParB family chromosome partitioning protein
VSRKTEKKGLGRGLSALLGDIEPVSADDETQAAASAVAASDPVPASVPIEKLHPNPAQPRRDFAQEDLQELAASIRERGVIQPVIVRPDPENLQEYQIVAGERRWRAAQLAQLHRIPVVVRDLDDRTVLEVAIIENVQRADLNPLEEAMGYAQLIERFGHTQEALARIVGKSRSHLANTLRLTGLPDEIQDMLRRNMLSAGHARAVLSAADPVALARRAVAEKLTVREIERLAKGPPQGSRSPKTAGRTLSSDKDTDTRLLEGDLSAAIGMKVVLRHAGDGGGEIRIRYRDLEELDRLCQKLTD